jgi:hypothetical protein
VEERLRDLGATFIVELPIAFPDQSGAQAG